MTAAAAAVTAAAAPEIRCPLCSATFDPSSRDCHSACPMATHCAVVCCPRCGYGFPQEDRGLAGLLKKALVRLGRSSR